MLDGHVAGLVCWAVDIEVVSPGAFDDWGDYGVRHTGRGKVVGWEAARLNASCLVCGVPGVPRASPK